MNLPAFIRHLYLQNTEYELPSAQEGKNLESLGLPEYLESFDLAQYPSLKNMTVGHGQSLLKYTGLKNYRQNVSYDGRSVFQLTSPSHPGDKYWFENGRYDRPLLGGRDRWYRDRILVGKRKYRTEEKEALKPVLNRPGVFVLDSKEKNMETIIVN